MGVYADMIYEGSVCEQCMVPFPKATGYPCLCSHCFIGNGAAYPFPEDEEDEDG